MWVSDVRSLGLLGCIELVSNGATCEPLSAKFDHGDTIEWFKSRVMELGLDVRIIDYFILIGPPLSITAKEIASGTGVLDEILREIEGRLKAA